MSAGIYQKTTLAVSKIADAASSLGNASSSAANLSINGGVLKYTGTGEASSRLFTIGTIGATLDSSGSGPVNFSNTGNIVSAEAPTGVTGTLTASNSIVATVNDISNLTVGMTVSGTNIAAGTTIRGFRPKVGEPNVNTSTGLTYQYDVYLSANATAAETNAALTFGNANRTLSLTGSNAGANTVAGVLSDAATGKLAIAKGGAGTWNLTGANTFTGGLTVNAGTLGVKRALNNGAVVINNGGRLQIGPGAAAGDTSTTSVFDATNSLTLNGTGTLDVNKSGVIFTTQTEAAVRALIASGRGSGNWTGTGITSAAGTGAVGYATGADLGGTGTFLGQPYVATDVLVRYTLPGDSNLDGTVNFSDLLALAANYNGTPNAWAKGDSNYDGVVNFNDLLALAANYNATASSSFAADWCWPRAWCPSPRRSACSARPPCSV
ncbi:MAG: autotransporter-associated beta strand repeat-containing protein [Tepidisphaeraceae bacterium]